MQRLGHGAEVRLDATGERGGDEYKQVIVPIAVSDAYFLAGRYDQPLRFEFEGKILSGEPVDLEGNPLSSGDKWTGPHPGIPYVLAAGGDDIRYTIQPRPNVEKDVKLSKAIGPDAARAVAARICSVKGFAGGRFYVNEFRTIFAPVQGAPRVALRVRGAARACCLVSRTPRSTRGQLGLVP
jgi:hypothetical protein